MPSLSQLLRCVAMLVAPPCVNLPKPTPDLSPPTNKLQKDYESVSAEEIYSPRQETALILGKKKKKSSEDIVHFLFHGINGLLKDNLFPAPAQNIDLISFVYVWTILCVPHFCVKTQKDETKTRDNKKHYRGF